MRYRLLVLTATATCTFTTPGWAEIFYDQARVLDVQPVYEDRRVPVQVEECGDEQPSSLKPVDPGILGDARNVDPGADLIGALQKDIELRQPPAKVFRCRMVTRTESVKELAGYQVRYEYEGRIYQRRVAEHPGDTMRVRIKLTAGDSESRFWR